MSVFLSSVLSKKYSHPSSDIIAVLAGLDYIDTIFTEFVGTLDGIIRNGKNCKELYGFKPKDRDLTNSTVDIRHKAIEVLLATTAGAYQTTLLTYMIQRDLFPSIMKVLYRTHIQTLLGPQSLFNILIYFSLSMIRRCPAQYSSPSH